MKMRNLGRVIGLFLISASLHAAVTASVDASKVIMGDTVTLTLKISGEEMKRPKITELCGEKILSSASATNIQSINGSFSKSYTLTYSFMPTKDCTIEPISMKVDGKEETTEAIAIKVFPVPATDNPDFVLEMVSDKRRVYVGEPFKVTLIFKKRHNHEAVDFKFTPPQIKHFWIKEETSGRSFEEKGYTVTKQSYIMAAQQPGTQQIGSAQMKIATRSYARDAWGQFMPNLKWRTYFSNTLDLNVSVLPENVDLVGEFEITAEADKSAAEPDTAVNVTLRITGSGNFEDIGSLKPSIAGVSVFEEEPQTKGYIENGNYKGVWKQKMALVGDRDFTIPPIRLRYFDTNSSTVKTIETKAIPVKVKGALTEPRKLTIERAPDEAFSETPRGGRSAAVVPFLFGLILGVSLAAVTPFVVRRIRTGSDKEPKRSVNDHKAVLAFLLQHMNDEEAAVMARKLEGNLYEGGNEPIEKKALKALLKRLESEG
jgi:hypothetical protein